MYQDGMTYDQAVTEFRHDFPELIDKTVSLEKSPQVKRLRRAGARYPVTLANDFHVSSGNHYLMVTRYEKRSDVFAPWDKRIAYVVGLYRDNYGRLGAVSVLSQTTQLRNADQNPVQVYQFVPHLFEQYADRANREERGLPLIREFFKANPYFVAAHGYERPGDPDAAMFTCIDGAVMGHWKTPSRFFVALTYIDTATMRTGYKSFFNKQHNRRLADYEDRMNPMERRIIKLRET